jgi:uncharacterized protein (UPF0333 family)
LFDSVVLHYHTTATDASAKRKRSDDDSITTDTVNNSNDAVEQRSPKAAKMNDTATLPGNCM